MVEIEIASSQFMRMDDTAATKINIVRNLFDLHLFFMIQNSSKIYLNSLLGLS